MLILCNRMFDSLGIASPYTIKPKLLVRESLLQQDRSESSKKVSWDSPVVWLIMIQLLGQGKLLVYKPGYLIDGVLYSYVICKIKKEKNASQLIGKCLWSGSILLYRSKMFPKI